MLTIQLLLLVSNLVRLELLIVHYKYISISRNTNNIIHISYFYFMMISTSCSQRNVLSGFIVLLMCIPIVNLQVRSFPNKLTYEHPNRVIAGSHKDGWNFL